MSNLTPFVVAGLGTGGGGGSGIEDDPNLVIFENFSHGACGFSMDWDDAHYLEEFYAPNTSQEPFVGTPVVSPACAGNYFIESGTDEYAPFTMIYNPGPDFSEFYVEFYLYFMAPFPFPGGFKLFRATNSAGGIGCEFNMLLMDGNSGLQLSAYDKDLDMDVFVDNGDPVMEDMYHKFGIYGKLNDVGVSNGLAKLYRDDVLTVDLSGLELITAANPWNLFFVLGNNSWGSGSGTGGGIVAPFDGNMYIDDVAYCTTLPEYLTP